MENIKERIYNLIKEIEQMIKNDFSKKEIENKIKELDELLNLYLKDI